MWVLERAAGFGAVPRAEPSRQGRALPPVPVAVPSEQEQGSGAARVPPQRVREVRGAADAGRAPQSPGKGERSAARPPWWQGVGKPARPFLQPEQLLRSAGKEGAKAKGFLFDKYIFDAFRWWGSLYAPLKTLPKAARPVRRPARPAPCATQPEPAACGQRQPRPFTLSHKMNLSFTLKRP